MRKTGIFSLAVLLLTPLTGSAEDRFLTNVLALGTDPRYGGDKVYLVENVEERLAGYDSVMVDEPEIFISPDSRYGGFKASDIAALSAALRQSFIDGLESEPVRQGQYRAVDEPGPTVLYMRVAMKNVYIKKKKRGLLSYTPVGAVAKGVSDSNKEAIDKSTLVEMTLEVEVHDSTTGETLAALSLDRGQRKMGDLKEDAAEWELSGEIVHTLGRRVACRLDNTRAPEGEKRDCITELPIGN